MHTTRCRPNGTSPYWPAVECWPPDRRRARWPARRLPTGPAPPAAAPTLRTPTDDDDRRQRAKQYWTIRWASNKVNTKIVQLVKTAKPAWHGPCGWFLSDFLGGPKWRLTSAGPPENSGNSPSLKFPRQFPVILKISHFILSCNVGRQCYLAGKCHF